jgi:hypothetical protein
MEIEDRVLVFIRYINIFTNIEKWGIAGFHKNDFEGLKQLIIFNKEYNIPHCVKEVQLIKNKFIPAY